MTDPEENRIEHGIDQAATAAYERAESAIQESNEGHSVLMDFVDRFGQVLEFKGVAGQIIEFLENEVG